MNNYLDNNPGLYILAAMMAISGITFLIYLWSNYKRDGDGVLDVLHNFDLDYPVSPTQRHIHNMMTGFNAQQNSASDELGEIRNVLHKVREEFLEKVEELKSDPELDKEKIFEALKEFEFENSVIRALSDNVVKLQPRKAG